MDKKISEYSFNELFEFVKAYAYRVINNYYYLDIDNKDELISKVLSESIKDYESEETKNFFDYFSQDFNNHMHKLVEDKMSNQNDAQNIILSFIKRKINSSDDYIESYNETMKLSNFFNEYSFVPSPDVVMKLLNSNEDLKNIIKCLVDKNIDYIKDETLSEVIEDNNICLLIDTYALINNIIKDPYEEEKNNSDTIVAPGINQYFKEIYNEELPLLTAEEEKELNIRIKNGDEEARNIFIERNLRLVASRAKKFLGRGLSYEDLVQEGNIGLMYAVDRYDSSLGFKFSTYAMAWIQQIIRRAIINKGRNVRLPVHLNEAVSMYRRREEELTIKLNKEPSIEQMAESLNISINRAIELHKLQNDTISLNTFVNDEESCELESLLPSNNNTEEEAINNMLPSMIKELYEKANLSQKEIDVLSYRYGLYTKETMTLDAIGKILNVTKERIRQIEKKAFLKIRRCGYARSFIEDTDSPDKARKRIDNFNKESVSILETNRRNGKRVTYNPLLEKNKTIYGYFSSYKKEDIDTVLTKLTNEERTLVSEIFSDNLNNNNLDMFYEVVVPKMKEILDKPIIKMDIVNEEDIVKLYEGVVSGEQLTTDVLYSYGFNNNSIDQLVNRNIIKKLENELYEFVNVEELYQYGQGLALKKNYYKANKCFIKCHEMDSRHYGSCFQLFLKSINSANYNESLKYFDVLYNTDNPNLKNDMNFFLFMLDYLTVLPPYYKELVNELVYSDMSINPDDKRFDNVEKYDGIRKAVFQRRFPYALSILNKLNINKENNKPIDVITRTLIKQSIEKENNNKLKILNLVKESEYDQLYNYLNDKSKQTKLSFSESYLIKIVEAIIEIKNTNIIPNKKTFKTDKIYEAIEGNNFELALKLSTEYNNKLHIDNEGNSIYLLLTDICNMIKGIKDRVITQSEKNINSNVDIESNNDNIMDIYKSIVYFLLNSEYNKASDLISIYLNKIDKSDYEKTILNLMQIDILSNDIIFTKTMSVLTEITNGNYTFDITVFAREFYISLSQNKFEEARLYCDIIFSLCKDENQKNYYDKLLEILNKTEKIFNMKNGIDIKDKNQEDSINKTKENLVSNEKQVLKNTKENSSEVDMYVSAVYETLLKEKGLVLSDYISDERIELIKPLLKKYNNLSMFVINNYKGKKIVFRYMPYVDKLYNLKEIIKNGNDAYRENRYNDCINSYLDLLKIGKPKAFVYAKLGLAYMKIRETKKAIDYLEIATNLSQKEDKEYDFTELILRLKGEITEDEAKSTYELNKEIFNFDSNESYYGINNFWEIIHYLDSNSLDVESACDYFNLNEEQKNIFLLLISREYYKDGKYILGDKFLRIVELSKNKTKVVLNLMDEIRINKKFYYNRSTDRTQKLMISIKTKK